MRELGKQRWPRHHTPRPSNTWGPGEVHFLCARGLVACGPGAGSFLVGLVEGPWRAPGLDTGSLQRLQ